MIYNEARQILEQYGFTVLCVYPRLYISLNHKVVEMRDVKRYIWNYEKIEQIGTIVIVEYNGNYEWQE